MEAITFRCISCKQVLKIAGEKAGRKAKCSRCGTVLTIPSASETEAEVPPPPPPPKPSDDDDSAYGLVQEEAKASDGASAAEAFAWKAESSKRGGIHSDLEDKKKKKPPIAIPKGQEPAKVKLRSTRVLLEPERWRKVMVGLRILGGAMVLGILALLMQKLIWLLASPTQQYAQVLLLNENDNPNDNLEGIHFFVALFTGTELASATILISTLAQVLLILQGFAFLGGYLVNLAVPPKFGTSSQVIALLVLGALNILLRIVFWLLPWLGFGYVDLPLLLPEASMILTSQDRMQPMMLNWMTLPFWETLLAIVLIVIQLAEPMLIGVYIRSLGLAMKDDAVAAAGLRLVKLTMSQAFIQLFFYLTMFCGTSNVLQWVLFIIYWMAWAFWLGTLILFIIILFWVPGRIQKELGTDDEE